MDNLARCTPTSTCFYNAMIANIIFFMARIFGDTIQAGRKEFRQRHDRMVGTSAYRAPQWPRLSQEACMDAGGRQAWHRSTDIAKKTRLAAG
jgi:hypothetical protein